MFRTLWLILHTLALLAEGGVSSGSGEVAGGNGGGNNNNGVGGGAGGAGAGVNGAGLPPGGLQPLGGPAFQLVPVGGSFLIPPFGNALAPQAPLRPQQLLPFGPFQQGAGAFYLAPQGAGGLIPQAQGGLVQAGAAGGLPLYTVLSQHGGPQGPMLVQGRQLQQQPGAALGGGAGNGALGWARIKRSVAAHPRRMQATASTGATARTAAAEEEESSGLDSEEQSTP